MSGWITERRIVVLEKRTMKNEVVSVEDCSDRAQVCIACH